MYLTYYTLRALTREWDIHLRGWHVADAISHEKDTLLLALATSEEACTIHISARPSFRYLFRSTGFHRPRKNVTTLLPEAIGRTVDQVSIAPRDRILFFHLSGPLRLQVQLFGPRPNIFLLDTEGRILDAFQDARTWQGKPAPRPRPAPEITDFDTFRTRWAACARKTPEQTLTCAWPLFDRTLALEALFRAGSTPESLPSMRLFEIVRAMENRLLQHPEPRLYWRADGWPETLALLPMHHLADLREERMETVDAAMRVFVRARLRQERLERHRHPLLQQLQTRRMRLLRRIEGLRQETTLEARARRYEHFGHLLMALAHQVPEGASSVTLPDILEGGEPVLIPLEPARSAIENAERYYERARLARKKRKAYRRQVAELQQTLRELDAHIQALRSMNTYEELERYLREHPEIRRQDTDAPSQPFRRFMLDGYEVLVGRNARENDRLTFAVARPHDYWFHARGVRGAHVILRWPHRNQRPPRKLLERVAALAAHFSEARTSGLVPVQVTQRKYVHRLRGGPPGAVRVEREEVLLVEPATDGNGREANL